MSTLSTSIQEKATITATGTSAVFRNPGTAKHQLIVDIASTPTGTSPTLLFEVDVSTDGVSFVRKGGALSSLNSISNQRTVYGPGTTQGQITETYIQVKWTIGGTGSPTFTNVSTTFEGVDC